MEQTDSTASDHDGPTLRIITPYCAKWMMVSGGFGKYGMNDCVLDLLHGRQAHCPECKTDIKDKFQWDRYYRLQRISCPHCGKQPTATKGTVLHNAQITPEELFIIAILSACNEQTNVIASRIGKTADTVREWKKKMEVLTPAYV